MKRRSFQSMALAGSVGALWRSPARAQANGRQKIKIGQIGTGHSHAAGQLAMLRQCADFQVVGVVEPDEAARKKVQDEPAYAGLPWLTEEQLLNTGGLQAVAVETDVKSLLDSAERVVNAGLHLHLDKPAGESFPRFKRILETAAGNGRLVKMGYMFRYNPAFQLMIKAVREGWLGEVFSIHAEMSKKLTDGERQAMLPYAGGSMFELGCHLLDSVVRVLGAPDKVTPHLRRSREDGYADNMLAVLDYPKATVTVRSAMIEVQGGMRRQFVVCGDRGTCDIRPLERPAMTLILDEPRGGFAKGVQQPVIRDAPRYAEDWEDFARAIRGEQPWEFTNEHDLAVQKLVLQASGMSLD